MTTLTLPRRGISDMFDDMPRSSSLSSQAEQLKLAIQTRADNVLPYSCKDFLRVEK